MTNPKSLVRACILATAAVLAGCATTALEAPVGFAADDHRDTDYRFRASDGEGVVLAVRTEKNRPQGDLPYWTAAVDAQLRGQGYQPNGALDVTSADGHAGKQLRYVVSDGGREIVFWLSLFVTDRHVVLVEAGGDALFFEPKAEQVAAAIATVQVG